MAWPKISVGSSDFAEYRIGDYYYVDKTGFDRGIIKNTGNQGYIDYPAPAVWKNYEYEYAGRIF